MESTPQPTRPTWEHRLQAVLALLGGEPVPHVTARFGMGALVSFRVIQSSFCIYAAF